MGLNHPTNERLYAQASVVLDELEQLPMGPGLVAGMARVQGMGLGASEAVRATVLWDRLTAHCQAQAMVTISEATEGPELYVAGVRDRLAAIEVIGEELATLSHVHSVTARVRVGLVDQVRDTLPLAWEALNRGDLRLEHLKAFTRETQVTTTRIALAVDAQLIPVAVTRGWTPGRLAHEARKTIITADPNGAADRAATAKRDADVSLYPAQDETAVLSAHGDAVTLQRVMDVITTHAAELQASHGDQLPAGLARFEALADLILGDPAARRTEVLLTVDLTTWLGLTQHPGEVTGYGPISPATARALTADAGFRLMLTDPTTNHVVGLGHNAYRPGAQLRRFIQARDRTCRFPGCQRPAIHCDLDHLTNYHPTHPGGGRTEPCNLHPLCRHHHNLKTRKLWHVDQLPNGDELWTSPLGFTHLRKATTYQLEPIPPPEDDEPPEHIANRIPAQRDPNPPRAHDPLPDLPTPTLEDYYHHTDTIEQQLINDFLTTYFHYIHDPATTTATTASDVA